MRLCQACRMANIKDGVKMTSTGAACSLDGRAHILCVSKQQEREESKRPRSVSGRRSNDTVSTFCTMKNISRFDEANTQKLPIYQTITPNPFPPLTPLLVSHTKSAISSISYPSHHASPCPSHPSHPNSQLHTYHSPTHHISHAQRFQSGFDSQRRDKTRAKVQ